MTSNVDFAISLFQEGKFNDALKQLNIITKTKKTPAIAWFLMAIIQTQDKKYAQAIASFKKALKQQPNYPDAHNNLAVVFEKNNNTDEAIKHYKLAIKQRPNYVSALFNLGNIYHGNNNLALAKKHYLLALKHDETHLKSHNNIGLLYQQENKLEETEKHFKKALELNPTDFETLNNLGYLYYLKNELEKSLNFYQQSINFNPSNPDALNNAGISLQSLQRFDDAILCFNQAIKLKPHYVAAYTNLANCYKAMDKPEKAKEYYIEALKISPKYPAANNNLGLMLHHEGQHTLAKEYYIKAIEGDTHYEEALYNLGTMQLASGDFIHGWNNYLNRPTPRHPLAIDVKTINLNTLSNQHVLLLKDQGIGDEIFFLRFIEKLKPYCKKLSYLSSNKIASFAQSLTHLDQVIINEVDIDDYDISLSIADIPALLAPIVKNNTLPSITIKPQADILSHVKDQLASLGPPPYIGITWRGGQQVKNLLYKAVPIEKLLNSIVNVKATFIILQRHPDKNELNKLKNHPRFSAMANMSNFNESLPNMVALLFLLDDYIGVSNTNMHLMAGLNKTAKVLIPNPPEWRWMLTGNTSPWFPKNTVYRESFRVHNLKESNTKIDNDKSWDTALHQLSQQLENQYGRSN